ncbi:T9SS type B sorting domain-containing protein [Flavobacterium caeni]|uniref:Gliding motility-associated C-terminal domain-containing protein n=1 Tax=Flavobacterium caeni TaxID=490189 RepID=A0A1G5HA46_9FLAO|nr:T9SS type B sorting domain-containing protein [Flavobacterium caeni]SCY60755.1 gliding motility-associated C-terminal domain-containing protein [Flavobacterium caeni]
MSLKNYPSHLPHHWILFLFLTMAFLPFVGANAQIYVHNFGTTAIAGHPYTVAPVTLESHLSGASWSNSSNVWTSTAGSTGEAIRWTGNADATITLTFNVAANFQVDIASFDFWRMRSNLGPQNWSMTINGIAAGNGTTDVTGAALGNTPVANTVSGLTGTITVALSLTGGTGNGTFRLDDFTLYGTVTSTCTGATIATILPASGPQNTLVTITGSGFLAGSGTSAVHFNGIPAASFTVVSDTVIKAYVPAGNASGAVSVTTNGCEAFGAATFTKLLSTATATYTSDIYISELYDAQAGDGGLIEIYNGTANPVNLAGYFIRRYGDVGGPTFYTINLSGTIQPGEIYLIGIGTGTTPCGMAVEEDLHYGTGFNSNDEFQLWNGGTMIDNVHAPVNVGYSVIRNLNAVAPNPVFNPSDWNTNTTESCANINIHNVPVNNPPTVTSPVSQVICDTNAVVFNVSLANPSTYTYQWKMVDASGLWVNVPNTAPFTGAQTATLTINPTPASLNESQYYCAITSPTTNSVSNAAQLEVNPPIIPDFATTLSLCNGDTAPLLDTTSPNGVTGSWSPPVIDNTTSDTYTFTPNAGQCATSVTLAVTVQSAITPDFHALLTICGGETPPSLDATSPNGVSGTWSPTTIDNTISDTYIFTPNAGHCATTTTLTVTVGSAITPDFATTLAICTGDTVPTLASTSPNGISGNWSPTVIDNTTSDTYIFTPDAGQCATTTTLTVTVGSAITPDFTTTLAICAGDVVPTLASTSPNGINGSWSPTVIDNTASDTYTFTPNAGQCATTTTLTMTIGSAITPDFATTLAICAGDVVPTLASTSPNGINGSWSPSSIDNTTSDTYTFTPNAGQCATTTTLTVTVGSAITPDFATTLVICAGDAVPTLASTSPNGITGSWSPTVIDNTTSDIYTFTPDAGQCATTTTLTVTVGSAITPDFATTLAICAGDAVPTLGNTSPNGINGSWSPSVIDNTTSDIYTFTPDAGQCATTTTLTVTVGSAITPDFTTTLAICTGDTVPTLASTSPNGISGNWSPTVIDNTVSDIYTFTPNTGQCATTTTLAVTLHALPQPVLNDAAICLDANGGVVNPALLDTGLNVTGYSFSWTWDDQPLATSGSSHLAVLPGVYRVIATNLLTGCTAQAQAQVSSVTGFVATALTGTDFDHNATITFVVSGGTGAYEFELDGQWTQQNNQFFNVDAGWHTIVVTDLNGCASQTLEVFLLDYPRFFTPNGDGYNDVWNIGGLSDQRDAKIYLFDRYGKLIKSLKPSDETGWDGTYNGKPLPATDYWFELFYSDRYGLPQRFKSHFSLKR